MPWTEKNYPASMKNLPEQVRRKAIEIANALLEDKQMDEGMAIATAISRAKDWAAGNRKEYLFSSRRKAVRRAEREARDSNSYLKVQGKNGKTDKRSSFSPNRRSHKS